MYRNTSDVLIKPIHVLIVDDDQLLRDLLGTYLRSQAIISHEAENGMVMREVLKQEKSIDLILLDLVMPGEDGLLLVRQIRSQSDVGIIVVSGLSDVIDRVAALEIGADDYLCKPVHPRELLARMRAVLRRSQISRQLVTNRMQDLIYCFDGWELHVSSRRLLDFNKHEVPLTTVEFDLLTVFASHPGSVLDRDQLMDLTKGRSWAAFDRSIDQQVNRLRRKIEPDAANPTLIKTVRGAGYIFSPKSYAQLG